MIDFVPRKCAAYLTAYPASKLKLVFSETLIKSVPDEGIEPPTFGLQNRCSTAELIRRAALCEWPSWWVCRWDLVFPTRLPPDSSGTPCFSCKRSDASTRTAASAPRLAGRRRAP